MKNQRSLFAASVVMAFAASCSEPAPDRSDRTRQRLEGEGEVDGGDGMMVVGPTCAHPICAVGAPLAASCDPCATNLCALDPYCCGMAWDATCVGEVKSICGQSCTAPPSSPSDGGASTCQHPVCATGGPLASGCESCATTLCTQDPYCCAVEWDATCVGEVKTVCSKVCN